MKDDRRGRLPRVKAKEPGWNGVEAVAGDHRRYFYSRNNDDCSSEPRGSPVQTGEGGLVSRRRFRKSVTPRQLSQKSPMSGRPANFRGSAEDRIDRAVIYSFHVTRNAGGNNLRSRYRKHRRVICINAPPRNLRIAAGFLGSGHGCRLDR